MADAITVAELDKPSGMEQGRPQSYEIAVTPMHIDRSMPDLPFLHKGDGITLEDGTGYWIESARQVAVKTTDGTHWNWVYRATRDTSKDPEPDLMFDDSPVGEWR